MFSKTVLMAIAVWAQEEGGDMNLKGMVEHSCPLPTKIVTCKDDERLSQVGVSMPAGNCEKMPAGPEGGDDAGPSPADECCMKRDLCLNTCVFSKKKCEEEFSECTDQICSGDQNCEMGAYMGPVIAEMVTGQDKCKNFNEEKNKVCQCVPESDYEDNFKERLTEFYQTHAPEELEGKTVDEEFIKEHVDPLVEDREEIWYHLHIKYPDAVQEKNESMSLMDKLMQQMGDESHMPDAGEELDDEDDMDDGEDFNDEEEKDLDDEDL